MAQDLDVATRRGRLRVRRFGPPERVATICVPGLSSNARVFDALGEYREAHGRGIVAVDLRGRGWSEVTPPGTYGWEAHAHDLFEVAEALDIERFNIVGHSMGAFVGMTAATLQPRAQIARLVLIDGLGIPTRSAIAAIVAGIGRLKGTYTSADAYIAAIRDAGLAAPWNAYWERHYRYDLIDDPSSVRPRTDAAAVNEDAAYGATHDPIKLWPWITEPALVVRASVPLGASDGFVVTRADYDAFLRKHPNARGVEIAANHFGVVMDHNAVEIIDAFLAEP